MNQNSSIHALGCLSECAVECASAVTGSDAVLEEAASAERQPNRLHIVNSGHEGFHALRTTVVFLAVPVGPEAKGIDRLAYSHLPLGVRHQWHAHPVRPPESRVETGRAGAGRTGCLRRRKVEPRALPVGDAASG